MPLLGALENGSGSVSGLGEKPRGRQQVSGRLDHDVEESLKFAAALVSIKMETPGAFAGTLDQVLERVRTHHQ